MRRILFTALGLSIIACCAVPIVAQRCGKERWSVKTGTDPGAASVDLMHPQTARIADLISISPPSTLPANSRFAPTENTVFMVDATLTDFKVESGSTGDSDYHLVLQDDLGNTMVAEIPSPGCVGGSSPFAGQIASVRAKFDAQFTATSSFHTVNVPVRVTGVGFFDFFHNQHGAAPNIIELHPVLDITFNPGPSDGDFSFSLSSGSVHLHAGSSSSVSLTASATRGSNVPTLAFAVTGLPSGVSSKVTTGTSGEAILALSAAPTAATGAFPVTVTGFSNGHSHSQTLALNVSHLPSGPDAEPWEYKLISAASEQDVIDQANQLGIQGWELVSVVRVSGSPAWRAFFKRATKD